jgi:hypothetical protein
MRYRKPCGWPSLPESGRHTLHNPGAFEKVFHGQLDEIPKAVIELARLLVDTKFTRVEQFENLMDEFEHASFPKPTPR